MKTKEEMGYESPEMLVCELQSEGVVMSWSSIENLEEGEGDWGW